jgi:hypothetical protein
VLDRLRDNNYATISEIKTILFFSYRMFFVPPKEQTENQSIPVKYVKKIVIKLHVRVCFQFIRPSGIT